LKQLSKKIDESVHAIKERIGELPNTRLGLILGSGLGFMADKMDHAYVIPYQEIPHFLTSTALGHEGKLVFGELSGKTVVAMQGRFHCYEGYAPSDIIYPVYVMKKMGVEGLIITNASGGINTEYEAGDLVAIEDVINFSFKNPLIGRNNDDIGPRFPDMSTVLDEVWFERVKERLKEKNKALKSGTYIYALGPMYETPAEIRAFRAMGADLVGMSTVPEIIACRHCGIRTFGISCVTNMAAGVLPQKLSHQEVMDTANRVKDTFAGLVHVVVDSFA
jgi:purine-nucleoside phosphorylase